MLVDAPSFTVKMAETKDELMAAQALRYQVFIQELGGNGDLVDHHDQLERDRFDPFFDHMLLIDNASEAVVGVYRLLREDQASQAGQFYSEDEFDLSLLRNSGRKLLELGRSCLHPDFRGGTAIYHLWAGLADYVTLHGIEILFGVASFHGTNLQKLAHPLSMLHHNHLAPDTLRAKAKAYQSMDLIARDGLDRRRAMVETPALIKAYLRLGGCVGDGAFVDHKFNTTDVCLILDSARMTDGQKRIYASERKRS
ncbi:GNAT family N-acetyltransferase [Parasedimentitalea huanghaiensis]|uniref:L-ornithine N(alpha)-acyltransferase n=1 Tax=Parasedimentitalea huanghaiensis TaxID=2682100 RepID=A0A6L6WFQ3_9RHOB|nr:GNAT family N-acyltransferase [Zongyanglinia huanghaiensis]MVO14512.1 GNAT family N-acetyltransferase [Zongyanglinia huanghaiensis]